MKATMTVCVSLGNIKHSINEIITTYMKYNSYEYEFSASVKIQQVSTPPSFRFGLRLK